MSRTTRPTVSVIMPSYNHAAFVEDAVRSVLTSQDAPPFEIVVVDDGSTDDSVEILGSIDDSRLVLLTQENQGAHVAFERGLDAARGDIVFLLNSDDLFAPRRLRDVCSALEEESDAVAAASWLQLIGPDGAGLGVKEDYRNMSPWPPFRQPDLNGLDDPRAALLQSNWIATTSNIAFHRGRLAGSAPSFSPLRYCHDWDFFLQLAAQGRILVLQTPLVSYRVHPQNTLKEGKGTGKALMELEILWLLARHALDLLRHLELGTAGRLRLWNSLPRFSNPARTQGILHQLFALRGSSGPPRRAFMDLLEPESDLRTRFLTELQS